MSDAYVRKTDILAAYLPTLSAKSASKKIPVRLLKPPSASAFPTSVNKDAPMNNKPTILEMLGGALGALIMWAFFFVLLSF